MGKPPIRQLRRPIRDDVAGLCLSEILRALDVRFVVVAYPAFDFDYRLGLAIAIALPQDDDEFFRFSAQSGEVIIGEFAPLLFHLAFELVPLAF
jgi:hypothetical protein